jgi:hypothetical protein
MSSIGGSSLLSHVAVAQCLNQDAKFTLETMMSGKAPLKSDCDEQLLITFQFPPSTAARIHGVTFQSHSETAVDRPSQVMIFLNEKNIIFGNVQGLAPRESAQLKWIKDGKGGAVAPLPLPKCRYTNAFSITIFVAANEGGEDQTVIDGIDLLGEMATGVGTSDLPKKG